MKKFIKFIAIAATSFTIGLAVAANLDYKNQDKPKAIQAVVVPTHDVIAYEIEKVDAKISHLEERMEEGDIMPNTQSWQNATQEIKKLEATKSEYVKILGKM